jgi:hypothetical protein
MLGYILPQFASAKTQAELFDSLDCDMYKSTSQLDLLSLLVEDDNDSIDSNENENESEKDDEKSDRKSEKEYEFLNEKNEKRNVKNKNCYAILNSFIKILKDSEFLSVKYENIDINYDDYNSNNDTTINSNDSNNDNNSNQNDNNHSNSNTKNNKSKSNNTPFHIDTLFKFTSTLAQATILSLSLKSQNANVHSQVSTYLENKIIRGYHRIPHGQVDGDLPHEFTAEGGTTTEYGNLPHEITRGGSHYDTPGGAEGLLLRCNSMSNDTLGEVGDKDLPCSSHDSYVTNDIYNIKHQNNNYHKNNEEVEGHGLHNDSHIETDKYSDIYLINALMGSSNRSILTSSSKQSNMGAKERTYCTSPTSEQW